MVTMRAALALLVLLVACSKSPAGPMGVDPTVLITNQLMQDTVFFTWRDGLGVSGADTILPGRTACEKFFARPDSAYFGLTARDQQNGNALGTYSAPWFNPDTTVEWTITVRHASSGSPDFLGQEVHSAPC